MNRLGSNKIIVVICARTAFKRVAGSMDFVGCLNGTVREGEKVPCDGMGFIYNKLTA